MKINWRYVVGVGTITGIIGLTTYSIILYKRQQKEDSESISHEEALEEMKEMDPDTKTMTLEEALGSVYEEGKTKKKYPLVKDPAVFEQQMAKLNSTILTKTPEEVEKEEIEEENRTMEEELRAEEEKYDSEPEPVLLEYEGENKLRYDPNSDEALVQYIRMETAEWTPSDYMDGTLDILFDIDFHPINDGDGHLFNKLVDYRSEFFGPASRWSTKISFMDVILHFSRLVDYNIGGGVKHWAMYFIVENDIDSYSSKDDVEEIVDSMANHVFYNEEHDTYGLFGLGKDSMTKAMNIASKNIDNSLTFEIEFNEFLKLGR